MVNEFIFEKRYWIGSILGGLIIFGTGLIIWQKIDSTKLTTVNQVSELQQQNDALRAQLSGQTQVAGASISQAENQGEKININTADLTGLDKLPGVGPAIGQRIIDYRNQNGPFTTIEDIKKVKGIGDATFEKMKNQITVGEN